MRLPNDCLSIYEQWHEFAKTKNVMALIDLYAEDAIFESPLVPVILDNMDSGVLIGRQQILYFLNEGTKRRPNELVRWYRTGKYLTDGHLLVWEYPRDTPNGDQIDILELMEIEQSKIKYHRIYWGWKGLLYIAPALICLSTLSYAQNVEIKTYQTPTTVSHEIAPLISAAPIPFWSDHPQSDSEWKLWVEQIAQITRAALHDLHEKMEVTTQPIELGNAKGFIITPKTIASENQNRILLHFHGGGYVLNPGEAGTDEAIMMAGFGQIRVVSIDYRMPPDYPFPAAMNDAITAYKELLTSYAAQNIGVFGTSTGGGMTLALIHMIKAERLAMPAAIAVGTPWTDLTKTGDSYFTNEGVDNILVSYDGWLGDAAKLYANGHDLFDPLLSPIYGDVKNFPPTILFTGTRDLFLSNTIRMHLKLREAGSTADLVVFEGQSHAQYLMNVDAPETERYFTESMQFFNRYLAQ